MTRRIILNPQGIRISRPGMDVIGATPEQLLFSSDINYPSLVESGEFRREFNMPPPTIKFSRSYGIAPLLFFRCVETDYWGEAFYDCNAFVNRDGNGYNSFTCQQGLLYNTPVRWWAYV